MKNAKTITVISTVINGRENFIHYHIRPRSLDNKPIVSFTIHPELAFEFLNEQEAYCFSKNIVNPTDRVFCIKEMEIDEQQQLALFEQLGIEVKKVI